MTLLDIKEKLIEIYDLTNDEPTKIAIMDLIVDIDDDLLEE